MLFVIGAAASVTNQGLQVTKGFYYLQFPAKTIILTVFRFATFGKEPKITRGEAGILFGLYLAYLLLNYLM